MTRKFVKRSIFLKKKKYVSSCFRELASRESEQGSLVDQKNLILDTLRVQTFIKQKLSSLEPTKEVSYLERPSTYSRDGVSVPTQVQSY